MDELKNITETDFIKELQRLYRIEDEIKQEYKRIKTIEQFCETDCDKYKLKVLEHLMNIGGINGKIQ
jgi:hypothetical protein